MCGNILKAVETSKKITIIGELGVGKSTFLKKILSKFYSENFEIFDLEGYLVEHCEYKSYEDLPVMMQCRPEVPHVVFEIYNPQVGKDVVDNYVEGAAFLSTIYLHSANWYKPIEERIMERFSELNIPKDFFDVIVLVYRQQDGQRVYQSIYSNGNFYFEPEHAFYN